ncbi:hypothetical protein FS837_012319 [Tulasnella sp. UAMH 9824]|nr:hypothetical protein FS837_012319 [Tulasnella sp. UAMH 9824]
MAPEPHAGDPIILQSLAQSCPKLKRLHWKPQFLPSSWSSILASSSLATSLEVLEIKSYLSAAATAPMPAPTLRLEFPSLHCLQICVDDTSLAAVIAEKWQLPSLKHLYIYQSLYDWDESPQLAPSVSLLISTHGRSMASLAIDEHAAYHIPLLLLSPAPILWRALEQLRILQDYSLPKLMKVVVPSGAFDTLQEPYQINVRLLDETKRLWVEPWLQETPTLLTRNDVRLFIPVETDQD